MNRKTICLNGQKIAFSPSPQKQMQITSNKVLSPSVRETPKKEDANKSLAKTGLIPTINIRTQISSRKWMKMNSKPFVPL
jgi:hypothetical protein